MPMRIGQLLKIFLCGRGKDEATGLLLVLLSLIPDLLLSLGLVHLPQ